MIFSSLNKIKDYFENEAEKQLTKQMCSTEANMKFRRLFKTICTSYTENKVFP